MNEGSIKEGRSIKDLGVTFQRDLKFKLHISDVINKAYSTLGVIRRNFNLLDKRSFTSLYTSLVRSKLEYAVSVWSPHTSGLTEDLERVQRRATKIPKQCKNMNYRRRMEYLNLPSLKYRRDRGDMIETFKILRGFYERNCSPALRLMETRRTRGNSFKLVVLQAHKDIRKFSFSLRVTGLWNSLSDGVVCSETMDEFKRRLDEAWLMKRFVW